MFFSPGCNRGHAAHRRRTPALLLKEDCQRHKRQWFAAVTANRRSRGGGGKGRVAGPRPLPRRSRRRHVDKSWRRRWRRRRQRRRRRFLKEPRPRAQRERLPWRRPASGGLGQGTTCWGTTRNQAVRMRSVWGCSRGEAPSGCPPSPSRSTVPPAGLAVAGPVIWRRTTVVGRS
jgi:hypothetical protein